MRLQAMKKMMLFFFLLFMFSGVNSQKVIQVAILELDPTGMEEALSRQFSNFFRGKLDAFPQISVLSDQFVQAALDSNQKAEYNFEDPVELNKIVEKLNVKNLILGNMARIGNLFTVSVKLYDSQTSEFYHSSGSYEGSKELFLIQTMEPVVDEIAQQLMKQDDQTSVPVISQQDVGKSWYKKWWVWTGIGSAAIIGGVVTALSATENGGPTTKDPKYLPAPPDLP